MHDFADGDSDLSAVRRSAQPGVMQSLVQPGIMQSLAQPGIMQSLADFDPEPEGAGARAQQRGSRWGPREVELLEKPFPFCQCCGSASGSIVRGMDTRIQIRIRIHTKMSWTRNTAFCQANISCENVKI